MTDTVTIPCIELPKIPDIPSITLLGGAEIKAFMDFAAGAPTDCKLTFNLLVQLGPLFASMACIFKIMNVIAKLKDFVTAVPDPMKLANVVPALLQAIEDLSTCIPIPGVQLYLMIIDILKLIIRFLSCFIDALESILKFQATIDLSAADDNPVLRATLVCAQDSANASMDNLMTSLEPLQPIMQVVNMLLGLANLNIQLPDISSITVGVDATAAIEPLKQAVDDLKQAVSSIPGGS